jgi:methyl-accepting chemotaxis protein
MNIHRFENGVQRALSKLRVGRRLAISVAVLVVPLTVLGYFYVQSKIEAAQVARLEKDGVDYLAPLDRFMRHSAEHRGLSNLYLNGNQAILPKIREVEEKVEKDLIELEARNGHVDAQLKAQEKTAAIKSEWSSLKNEALGLAPADSFSRHTALIKQALELNDTVTKTSILILDTKPETWYLMDATALHGAPLAEKIGVLRGFATGLVQKGATEPAERVAIAAQMASVNEEFETIKRSLADVYRYAPSLKSEIDPEIASTESKLRTFLGRVETLSRGDTLAMTAPEFFALGTAALDEHNKLRDTSIRVFHRLLDGVIAKHAFAQWLAILLVVATVLIALLIAFVTVRSVTNPVGLLTGVVDRLAKGDNDARARLDTPDEIGTLARQFDVMMDERVATQAAIQKENDQLNESILGLLVAVAQLARRDLTIKMPVTEDVTGPLADALNLLSGETAKVLQEVSNISADVTSASLKVKQQSDTVMAVAENERREVELTAESLAATVQAMDRIAELARICNVAADNAIETTEIALQTVNGTVGGINGIRDTIRETEKRIKRLGERSQEISGVVNLINSIAERTHILALNASMHAASAGEAGRGFAVVADEVQRLAENARQATAQIATLVNNIQTETSDTVTTMNTAISQVVEGSKLAEQAGEQMKRTQETTATLVASVQKIAHSSQEQAKASNELLTRAKAIQNSSQETSAKLEEQNADTNSLVEYAKSLIGAVRVFKLPA